MRACTFTPLISRYSGPPKPLQAHIKRCESCRLAALILVREESFSQIRTESCPDPGTLAAYDEGALEPAQMDRIENHVNDCGFCLELLREEGRVEAKDDPLDVLRRADRDLRAYLLAQEVAEWLVREKYQEEKDAVRMNFDASYDPEEKISSESGRSPLDTAGVVLPGGFHFSHPEKSRASQIIAVSKLLAEIVKKGHDRSEVLPIYDRCLDEIVSGGIQRALANYVRDFLLQQK